MLRLRTRNCSAFNCLALAVLILTSASTGTAQPVPTPPPNVPSFSPAFPGQTRAGQVISNVNIHQETVARGLNHPWAIKVLPDERFLVTERVGNLRVISKDGTVSPPISGLPKVEVRGQGGLLDVVPGPNFKDDRMIYWSYAEARDGDKNTTSVARGHLSEDMTQVTDIEVIFRQQPAWDSRLHFGSRLVWDRDGLLYITLGERSLREIRGQAQLLNGHIGKVVRIHPDGSVPDSNPFTNRKDAQPEIWSYGHRNIQGAALHPETGALWTIEHGPQGGDELNIPEAGKNYGWPVITYGENYNGTPIGDSIAQKEGMEQPIYYWDPVIAPGGMVFYTGDMFPEWRGNLLVSSLSPGALVRLELDSNRVTGEERLLKDIGRVRDVAIAQDSSILVITDHKAGKLIRLTRKAE